MPGRRELFRQRYEIAFPQGAEPDYLIVDVLLQVVLLRLPQRGIVLVLGQLLGGVEVAFLEVEDRVAAGQSRQPDVMLRT